MVHRTGRSDARRFLLRELRAALMIVSDAFAILLAGLAAYLCWALPVRDQQLSVYAQLWPALPLFLLGYAQAGLYPGNGLGPVETMRRISTITLLTFIFLSGFAFAVQAPYVFSRITILLGLTFALLFVPLFRLAALALATRTRWWPEPVVVAADDPVRASRVARALAESPQLGYSPRGILWIGRIAPQESKPNETTWNDAASAARESAAEVALLASGEVDEFTLDSLHQRFRRVLVVRDFDDLPVEGIRAHNLGGFLALEFTNNLLDRRNQAVKRALDLLLATAALIISLPVLIVAMLAVRWRSPGPALFLQDREGLGGRRIRVAKVRTMEVDAENRLEEALSREPALREEWRLRMKLQNDPRLVPGIGRLLRRFSVDELPQLWNVVRGEMSLVGPRPFPDYHLAELTPRFRELRRRVRPGVTGLWQVTVRSEGSIERQQSLDAYYIRNWSLWLDLYILARTVGAVVSGRGAY